MLLNYSKGIFVETNFAIVWYSPPAEGHGMAGNPRPLTTGNKNHYSLLIMIKHRLDNV